MKRFSYADQHKKKRIHRKQQKRRITDIYRLLPYKLFEKRYNAFHGSAFFRIKEAPELCCAIEVSGGCRIIDGDYRLLAEHEAVVNKLNSGNTKIDTGSVKQFVEEVTKYINKDDSYAEYRDDIKESVEYQEAEEKKHRTVFSNLQQLCQETRKEDHFHFVVSDCNSDGSFTHPRYVIDTYLDDCANSKSIKKYEDKIIDSHSKQLTSEWIYFTGSGRGIGGNDGNE